MGKINRISVSSEELELLQKSGKTEHVISSVWPTDKPNCPCQAKIRELKTQLSQMSTNKAKELIASFGDKYECPRSKEGATQYKIHCQNCGELVATCYSTDAELSDYFDFHYVCRSVLVDKVEVIEETDEKGKIKKRRTTEQVGYWQGAMAINVSPIDLSIGIECACGEDTRDFRGNMTIPSKERIDRVKESMKGKRFGKSDSRFKATRILTKKDK